MLNEPPMVTNTAQMPAIGMPLDLNSLTDLSQDDVGLEEVVGEEGFDQVGSVDIPPEVDYIELKNSELLPKLKPFLQKKAQSRDIITKSLLVRPLGKNEVELRATDGISYLRAVVPCVNNHFPKSAIIDSQSFDIVSRTHSSKTYLIHRNGNFYSDFYGGEIFIPGYGIKEQLFENTLGEVEEEGVVDISLMKAALTSLAPVLATSEVPELSYVFAEPDGVYSCNGILVGRVLGKLPSFVIRHADIKLILYMLEAVGNEILVLKTFKDFCMLSAESFSYVVPRIPAILSDDYKKSITELKGKCYVNMPFLGSILSTLNSLPEDSGMIDLQFKEDCLVGVSKTRKGEESYFTIANTVEGSPEVGSFGVSNKALITVMAMFKGESTAAVAYAEGKLIFKTEKREAAVILKR